LETVKADVSEKEAQLSKLDCEKREAAPTAPRPSASSWRAFVDSLATMLGTAYNRVPSTEEAGEGAPAAGRRPQNHSAAMAGLERRVKTVTGQLEQQLEANRKREERGVAAEGEAKELRDKLRAVEAQLAAGDVIRESLRGDKRLGQALSMEASAIDVGYDVLGERPGGSGPSSWFAGRRLLRLRQRRWPPQAECDSSLKEQLESKDLHLELMRGRLAQAGRQRRRRAPPAESPTWSGRGRGKRRRRLEKAHRMLEDARREADENLRAAAERFGECAQPAASAQTGTSTGWRRRWKPKLVAGAPEAGPAHAPALKTSWPNAGATRRERCAAWSQRSCGWARQELDVGRGRGSAGWSELTRVECPRSYWRLRLPALIASDLGQAASSWLWQPAARQAADSRFINQQPQFQQHLTAASKLHCRDRWKPGRLSEVLRCGGGAAVTGGGGCELATAEAAAGVGQASWRQRRGGAALPVVPDTGATKLIKLHSTSKEYGCFDRPI
uniref:ANK_REP_REGION domain-containing protein n=1 Tax=Macrostomum lignano TaxID=282301 RepID=A0A1I8FP13_9PLAT